MARQGSNAGSSSEQSGAATRGSEVGSASAVTASGAAAGTAATGVESKYGVGGAEGISDVGQAEAQIVEVLRGSKASGDFDQFLRAHYARIMHNAETYDKTIDSLNQTQREITVKQDDKTDSLDLAVLVNGLATLGMKLSVVASQ